MKYTKTYTASCPVDSSKVVHTVCYVKSTCTRFDDTILEFRCNRNSSCVKCLENYR